MNIGEQRIADLINNRLQRVNPIDTDMDRLKKEITELLQSLVGQFYTRETEYRVRMTLEEIIDRCSIRYVDKPKYVNKPKKVQPKADVPDYAIDPLELLGEGDDGGDSSTESWWIRSPQRRILDTTYWMPYYSQPSWTTSIYQDKKTGYSDVMSWWNSKDSEG